VGVAEDREDVTMDDGFNASLLPMGTESLNVDLTGVSR